MPTDKKDVGSGENDSCCSSAPRAAQQQSQLSKANPPFEEFVAALAHDFRSPLLVIIGYCQLLQDDYGDQLPKAVREYLERILDGAHRMERRIEDMQNDVKADPAEQSRQKPCETLPSE